MAQVGADDDQSPIAVPERFQDLGHRLGIGPADQEWNDGEGVEHDLEEGKLDLEHMVAIVCLIVEVHLGGSKLLDRGAIHWDASQWGQELLGAGGRQAADTWRMAGAQQDDSFDLVQPGDHPGVTRCRDRSGEDITGVRHDQGFGPAWHRGAGGGQELDHLVAQLVRVRPIKTTGDGRRTDLHGGHPQNRVPGTQHSPGIKLDQPHRDREGMCAITMLCV